MAKQIPSSLTKASDNASERNSLQPADGTEAFLIQKGGLQLKVFVKGREAAVGVWACKEANKALALSIARVQEQLLQGELQAYEGHHPYAFLMALYDSRGWLVKNDGLPPLVDGSGRA